LQVTASVDGVQPADITGGVTFSLYTDLACTTPISSSIYTPATVAWSPGGASVSAPPASFTRPAGAVYWQASYGGNGDYDASLSLCVSSPDLAPGAPTSVLVPTRSSGSAVVTWTPAPPNGGTAETYSVTTTPAGGTCASPTSTSCTVTGLTNGTSYRFTVVATNSAGSTSSALSSAAIPLGVPGAPTLVSAVPANTGITLTFTQPSNFGQPLYAYYGSCVPTGGGATQTNALNRPGNVASVSLSIWHLLPGVHYDCFVLASNTLYFGPASNTLGATADVAPLAPGFSVAPSVGQLTFTWSPPGSNSGSPVTGYSLSCTYLVGAVKHSIVVDTSAGSPLTLTGLTNGTPYTCKLAAANAVGAGATTVTSTPRTVPDAAVDVQWTAKFQSASVTWSPPSFNGGSAINGYVVTCTPVGPVMTAGGPFTPATVSATVGATIRSTTLSHLWNLAPYNCTVVTRNVMGTGAVVTTVVTPIPLPTAPTNLVATKISHGVVLTFKAPPGEVTGYVATCTSGLVTVAVITQMTTATAIVVTGLNPSYQYSCAVAAINSYGTGPKTPAKGFVPDI